MRNEREPTDAWFRPKTRGYGAHPVSWKGWAAIGAYVAALAVLTPALLMTQRAPSKLALAVYLAAAAALTIAFVMVARRKTDGDWRWRWGEQNRDPGSSQKSSSDNALKS